MAIRRELNCTMCERDKRITKFALIAPNDVAQDVGLFNFMLRAGESMRRGASYRITIEEIGPVRGNGQ